MCPHRQWQCKMCSGWRCRNMCNKHQQMLLRIIFYFLVFCFKSAHKQLVSLSCCEHKFLKAVNAVSHVTKHSLESRQTHQGFLLLKDLVICDRCVSDQSCNLQTTNTSRYLISRKKVLYCEQYINSTLCWILHLKAWVEQPSDFHSSEVGIKVFTLSHCIMDQTQTVQINTESR